MISNHEQVRFLRDQAVRLREIARECRPPASDELVALALEFEAEAAAQEAGKS